MSLTYSREQVEELEGFFDAASLLEANGIPYENLETFEDLKSLLLSRLSEASGPHQNKASDVIKEIIEKDAKQRNDLSQIYMALLHFTVHTLDTEIKEQVKKVSPGFDQLLVKFNSELVNNECPILVAGETSAGKSSLLNLILGEDVLPYSLLSATSVICHLKNGPDKKAVIHMSNPDPMLDTFQQMEINLSTPAGSSPVEAQKKLNEYVNATDRTTSRYKYVEIYWPIPLLQGNVFIVDSPGIGENEEMTQIVMDFLPKAFAFIYVINSGNAGGVQEDRLERLLDAVKDDSKQAETLHRFDSRSAVFVFNKWDQVPKEEEDVVKTKTLTRLTRLWPGLDPQKQVFYMSTTEAIRRMRSGAGETESFSALMNGIQNLVPTSLQMKIVRHYEWLERLVDRLMHSLRTRITNARKSAQEKKDRAENVRNRLNLVRTKSKMVLEQLEEKLVQEVDSIVDKIFHHLHKEETIRSLQDWNESTIPDADTMENVHLRASVLIQEALEDEIRGWDERNGFFRLAREDLFNHFKQQFNLVDSELRQIQGSMEGDGGSAEPTSSPLGTHVGDQLFSQSEKVIITLTAPLWVPLALVAAVIALPIIGGLAAHEKLQQNLQLRKYKANRVACMKEWTQKTIDSLQKKDIREGVVEKQLEELKESIRHMRDLIPRIIEADEDLINAVEADARSMKKQLKHYNPLYRECENIRGLLYFFSIRHLKEFTHTIDDLKWDERTFIASGSFASVFKVPMKQPDGTYKDVAAKKMKDTVSDSNIGDFCSEEETLRLLRHKYVVRYIATIYWVDKQDDNLIMLTELCSGTLRDAIFKRPERIPARHHRNFIHQRKAFAYIAPMARQLAEAIAFIHSKGFIHRDLKLENVLVTNDETTIKVSDVGLTKAANEISGTLCGTVSYLPPEVLESQPYNNRADIYSFGMVLYEMWYGKKAFHDIIDSVTDQFHFVQLVKNGERPNLKIHAMGSPCKQWTSLMEQCWQKIPEKRPSAQECFKMIDMTCSHDFIEETFPDPSKAKPVLTEGKTTVLYTREPGSRPTRDRGMGKQRSRELEREVSNL